VGAQQNPLGKAVYKKGNIIEVSEVIKVSDKEYWGKTVDGYVALMFEGNKFV
jgi:hypothetical protein